MAKLSAASCVSAVALTILLGHFLPCEASSRGRPPLLQVDAIPERPEAEFVPASEGAYGSVVKLNDQIFRGNVLREEDDRVVHWVVYWCPDWWEPCQIIMQDYKKLAIQWQQEMNAGALFGLQVRFARVDCATDKVLCNAMSVNDYPMVHHYTRGKHVSSWTDRTSQAGKKMALWLKSRLGQVPMPVPDGLQGFGAFLGLDTIASSIRAAFLQEHAAEALLVIVILGMNCWSVIRSPLLKPSVAAPPAQQPHIVGEHSHGSEPTSNGVEHLLPEEWLCQPQPVEDLEL